MKASVIVYAGLLSFLYPGTYAQGINDAQIASIVVTANQVDIDAGTLVLRGDRTSPLRSSLSS